MRSGNEQVAVDAVLLDERGQQLQQEAVVAEGEEAEHPYYYYWVAVRLVLPVPVERRADDRLYA